MRHSLVPATFLMSGLDFGERRAQCGEWLQTVQVSLASCLYHTGRAEGALCGLCRQPMAGQTCWVVLKIDFPLVTNIINKVAG